MGSKLPAMGVMSMAASPTQLFVCGCGVVWCVRGWSVGLVSSLPWSPIGIIEFPFRICVRRLLSAALTRSHVDTVGGVSASVGAAAVYGCGAVVLVVWVVPVGCVSVFVLAGAAEGLVSGVVEGTGRGIFGGVACSCSSHRCAHLCMISAMCTEFVYQFGMVLVCSLVGWWRAVGCVGVCAMAVTSTRSSVCMISYCDHALLVVWLCCRGDSEWMGMYGVHCRYRWCRVWCIRWSWGLRGLVTTQPGWWSKLMVSSPTETVSRLLRGDVCVE